MNQTTPPSKLVTIKAWKVAPLLFASGLCALIYEVVWLRELRLVFGSSTASSSTVLAIFLGGLGLGGAVIGKFADKQSRPLLIYAILELFIAVSAMLTPFLISLARHGYIGMGGPQVMGLMFGTLVRLGFTSIILGIPTFLMGGTLAAAVKAVETSRDLGRRDTAFLYGSNTLGAVVGVTVATFYMLELFGTRKTLWLSGSLNLFIGGVALAMARFAYKDWRSRASAEHSQKQPKEFVREEKPTTDEKFFRKFIYIGAGILGFTFLLMELVWYRMLGPILGGSTYMFGQILAVALFGIGIGSSFYATRGRSIPASMEVFFLTCTLEAFFLAIPYGFGDHLAIVAALIKPLSALGLHGNMVGWTFITCIVVLPASIVSGYQFPLLIGLMGQGNRNVASHTGYVYAWNTFGAIIGSLVGGFLLLPWLTAPGCWKLAVCMLVSLGFISAILAFRKKESYLLLAIAAGFTLGSILLLLAQGPTAVWRHSPIGAGRVDLSDKTPNDIRAWMHETRLNIAWEAEGIESSVSMKNANSIALFVNGKSDGNAKWDAGTQVMGPLLGALLHPFPERAMVIGLGTGSGAGWLGAVDSIKHVDVVELEPKVLEVARKCAPINHNVLENSKTHLYIGDGREVLLTSREEYDIVFSEPSNPYRAGVASLYTQEFYHAVDKRLAPRGIFSQWVQGYEVDTETIRTIYATLSSVFPYVETWETQPKDILFLCSRYEIPYSVPYLRKKIQVEPFRSALLYAWQATDLEGVLARYVAQPGLARIITQQNSREGKLNTDDRMLVEFGFAGTVGKPSYFSVGDVRKAAEFLEMNRPKMLGGEVDWQLVRLNSYMMYEMVNEEVPHHMVSSPRDQRYLKAFEFYNRGDLKQVLWAWNSLGRKPVYPLELVMVAEALAEQKDSSVLPMLDRMRQILPVESDAILARYYWRKGNWQEAYNALEKVIVDIRVFPWAMENVIENALVLASEMSDVPSLANKLYPLLEEPFSVYMLNDARRSILLNIAIKIDCTLGSTLLEQLEPNVPWYEAILRYRYVCYKQMGNPLEDRARRDLQIFLDDAPVPFGKALNKAKGSFK